jgi:hypothetical protein
VRRMPERNPKDSPPLQILHLSRRLTLDHHAN